MRALLIVPAVVTASLFATATQAQPAEQKTDELEEILVRAHPLSGDGLSQAALVVEGDELKRNLSANIGETLARQPGIQNSSFGNAAGRPVIRGLAGPRVRMMEDRLDTLDVSVTSVDHAVTVDPLIADRVEILKGPSSLPGRVSSTSQGSPPSAARCSSDSVQPGMSYSLASR